ncbi:MAG: hypothetical protein ACYDD1_04690 [Caulobacteraceae bacterium]
MNLHAIVSGAISVVNPFISAGVQINQGSTIAEDGTQIPTLGPVMGAQIQVQSLQYNDIAQLDNLNIQGERRKVYLNGNWDGLVRIDQRGGDLITFPEFPGGVVRTWLVVMVLEHWPDWTSVAVTLQDDEPSSTVAA